MDDVFDTLKKWNITNYKDIDKQSIEEITLGASILATGGGGNPEIGRLWALKTLEEGKKILLIDPMDVPDDVFICTVSPLGSPVVLTEKPPNQATLMQSVKKLEKYIGKKIEAIVPPECGGVASIVSYAVAGELGIPVIDADGMNRAFPELQMTSWATHGISPSPTVLTDDHLTSNIIDTDDYLMAESIARKVSMSYGGIAWIAAYPMTGRELKETSILNSQSMAWDTGKAVMHARRHHLDPSDFLLETLKEKYDVFGIKIFEGKISDIQREFGGEITKGFTMGKLIMEGINNNKDETAVLDYQNEWLNLLINGEVKCLTPDLIAIIDIESGEPIRTEIVKYGYRGSIILLATHERMRTLKGIETFGPRYFGYDLDYIPVERLNENSKVFIE